MSLALTSGALRLLQLIKCGKAIEPHEWQGVSDPEILAYLRAERAIVDERYSDISDELVSACRPFVAGLILSYRDLFLHPRAAVSRIESLLVEPPQWVEPCWIARMHFWLADALHLIGDVEPGQRALAKALVSLDETFIFRAEALTVTALSEYLAGNNESAAAYHYRARAELERNPDTFLTIFNSSMALRVFLKAFDPVGFEVFSADLDRALLCKEDRRYLLRQTGYRAMLMTLVGDAEEAARLWTQADELAEITSLRWERGQYGILRALIAAKSDGLEVARRFFDRAEEDLASVGFPGPYRAELDCARALAPALAWGPGTGLRQMTAALEEGRAALRDRSQFAGPTLIAYYRQADEAFAALLDGVSADPSSGPSLVVSIATQLRNTGRIARELSDFRVLPRFVQQLKGRSGTREDIAFALQEAIQLPVRITASGLEVDAPLRTRETRPDFTLVFDLAEALIRDHDLISSGVRARAIADLSAQVAHDIRSPLGALKIAKGLLGGTQTDEAQLIAAAVSRIQEIADDLLKTHRGQVAQCSSGEQTSWQPGDVLQEMIREKQMEYAREDSLSIRLVVDLPPEQKLHSDLGNFRRAMSNLVNNAAEASGLSGEVLCSLRFAGMGMLEVSVRDSGPGFTTSQLESFGIGPARGLTTTKAGGSGLGLKHAREFAESSGGTLWIRNRDDRSGAVVGMLLPTDGEHEAKQPYSHG